MYTIPTTILIYRITTAAPTKKPTKAARERAAHALQLARVRRPELEQFIESGGFHRLTAVTRAEVKDVNKRRRDLLEPEYYYMVSRADLGRAATSGKSTAESVRAWILKYYGPEGAGIIGADEFAVVFEGP